MFVKHLTLANFRNYTTAEVELQPGLTLFVGPNGQGKTNLVEAIRYLSTLSSHRVAGYLPLIRMGENSAVVRALASHDDRDVQLELELNRETKNIARLNKVPVQRMREMVGVIQSVTFAPQDLDIVTKDPTNRRAFIDELVVQYRPRMAGVYADYERVLKQRNTLLKTARATRTTGSALSTLDAWDASLIQYGSEIISQRIEVMQLLQPHLFHAYQNIAVANNEPKMIYRTSLFGQTSDDDETEVEESLTESDREKIAELFTTRLAEIRPKELERGITLAGPQRDDLLLMLGALPAKGYASHGEQWSYALALRLASVELLRADSRTGDPVLILDDVFAELDAQRRLRLAELVTNNEQVLITAAVEEDVPTLAAAAKFHVKTGTVTRG